MGASDDRTTIATKHIMRQPTQGSQPSTTHTSRTTLAVRCANGGSTPTVVQQAHHMTPNTGNTSKHKPHNITTPELPWEHRDPNPAQPTPHHTSRTTMAVMCANGGSTSTVVQQNTSQINNNTNHELLWEHRDPNPTQPSQHHISRTTMAMLCANGGSTTTVAHQGTS